VYFFLLLILYDMGVVVTYADDEMDVPILRE